MIESEAKTKTCPFIRMPEGAPLCLASGCMAWQIYESAQFQSNAEYVYRRDGRRMETTEGYCSLGARPEVEKAPRLGSGM